MRKVFSLLLPGFFILQFAPLAVAPCAAGLLTGFVLAEDNPDGTNEWDFGSVQQGSIVKHDFIFKNETPATLKITGINTSCGCTASQAEKKSLEPGESTVISVSFNSKGYSGAVKQFVYINTDNAFLAVIRFVIKAEVEK